MERILNVWLTDGSAGAYPFTRLRSERFINDLFFDTPFVVFWKAGTASALNSVEMANGQDAGSTGDIFAALMIRF